MFLAKYINRIIIIYQAGKNNTNTDRLFRLAILNIDFTFLNFTEPILEYVKKYDTSAINSEITDYLKPDFYYV